MRIFVASVNQDGRAVEDIRYLELRNRISLLGFEVGHDPWIAEHQEPDLPSRGWRATIDTCVHALHGSDLMVILLYRRLGTSIEIDALGPSPVTYLEIELFHAALRRIPLLVFQADDFDPDPRLAATIALLKRIIPAGQWIVGPERHIEREVLDTVRSLRGLDKLPSHLNGFCDALSDERSFIPVDDEVRSARLSFLHNFAPGAAADVSLERVDLCLAEAEALVGSGEGSHVDRLSRLWLALRELAQCPAEALNAVTAARWVRLCELWTNAAAWLHLHGPLELGVLATLHTRVEIRNAALLDEQLFPYGAYASEAYSIAKVSDTAVWQRRRFQAARQLATRQIGLGATDPSAAYGIRASATMQIALRGRPWLAAVGLRDYRRMLRERERRGASESELGEAQVELGYAEFMIGRRLPWLRQAAIHRMRDGVRLLEGDRPEQRAGFVKRGKLKLIEALEQSGELDEAKSEREKRDAFSRAQGLPLD
jgi:hypothetical protein